MKVLIVGAGIAGLTLAAFLKQHKHIDVDIIERQKDWSHIGYTIGIWEIGRQILSKIDLATEFDKHSKPLKEYYLENKDGQKIRLYHFDDFYKKYETAYSHINREALHNMLIQAAGTKIQMNTTLTSMVSKEGKQQVRFSNKKTKQYDLVVGADGIKSQIRTEFFTNQAFEYTGNRVWYAWIPNKYGKKDTVIEYMGKGCICNIFDDPKQTCMVLTAPETPGSVDDPKTRIQRLNKHFADFNSPVLEIINSLKPEQLMPTDIAFVHSEQWIKDNLALIGDAAHAMEPFAGIGASMGMEDAYVLAEELAELSQTQHINAALTRYYKRRLPRVNLARKQTRTRYWWITTSLPGATVVRNAFAKVIPIKHFTKGYWKLLQTKP